MRHLRLALRALRTSPFVTAIAVASLALGIGANAAIFSLFHQMLLEPLPVPHPEQLVDLGAPGPKPGSTSCSQAGDCTVVFSYPMFRDLERAQTVFTGIAAHRSFSVNVSYDNRTLGGDGMMVSGSYFPVLELHPALGRLIGPDDDRTGAPSFVAVLSHDFWTSKLGSDPGVVGRTIIVNGQHLTIIGVAPRGFAGTTLGVRPTVFVPISMRPQMQQFGASTMEKRTAYWVYLFARLKPGVTLAGARAALDGIYQPIIRDVEAPLQQGMSDQTMARFRARHITLEDGRRGQSSIHKEARTPLVLLFATTAIVLLIACANIANLLLARGAHRSQEMAVRLALGGSRRQLVTQLLTESAVLGVLGGIASLLVARWTLAFIASILPSQVTEILRFQLDLSVVLFAAVVAIGTGFLFGLFPAVHSTRPDLITMIRATSGQPSGARAASRFRTSLVTAQIALSMMLLTVAGLFVRSLVNVSRVDLGLRTENVVTFTVAPALNGYTPARSQLFLQRLRDELAATPGVTGVSGALVAILSGDNWANDVNVEGFKRDPDTDANSRFNEVSPDYFRVLGIPLLAGREFTAADHLGAPRVAIVNEAFVRKFRLGRDVVGKHVSQGKRDTPLDIEIVGLVKDAKYNDVKDEIPPQYFTPYAQDSMLGGATMYVRTSLPPAALQRAIPGVVSKLDPDLPVQDLKTLPQQVRENVFLDRLITSLSSAFATLATLLAAVGLYGVLAFTIAQRTREIGLRMALGADARRIRVMVLRQVALMTVVGGLVGTAAAIAIGRGAGSLLYRLQGWDPLVLALAVISLAIVALAAGYVPARRASRVDPMTALRYE